MNNRSFSFKSRLISIKSKLNNLALLNEIFESFNDNYLFYKFYFLATSGETLINRNNTFLLRDFKALPFIKNNFKFSQFDKNIIGSIVSVMLDFYIHGEYSNAVKPIETKKFNSVLTNYGSEFSSVLNTIYKDNDKEFRLSEVTRIDNSYIATVFKYDNLKSEPIFQADKKRFDIEGLTHHQVSQHLNANRIIKLYPKKDTIVFIKPNQLRYWISLIAYRDADKCFADLANAGY